ncbi:d1e8bf29-d604-4d19-b8ae-3a32c28da54f [Thermothielavioides terrestris]|uniref:D1e8bf29-d604-4d19-b8ae-3a32c28da54f n=2 Tax=Thermothielavioides terrestris TaxID=2587410 RepID=A0A446BM81_9PEZI|nr:d1e8bf29-d604-4d19-b8ae-3a32c28da54f [Thermothielavioides terrestris]
MPTPHLHPRSRMTSSLFATTLLASFVVVALPHVLPCPAPRRAFADDGGGGMSSSAAGASAAGVGADRDAPPPPPPRRMRRRTTRRGLDDGAGAGEEGVAVVEFQPGRTSSSSSGGEDERATRRGRRARECPVPKPGGILGEWLGFTGGERREAGDKTRPDR